MTLTAAGQFGPEALLDASTGKPLLNVVVSVPDGYTASFVNGMLTVIGPPADAVAVTVTPQGKATQVFTVRVEASATELAEVAGLARGAASSGAISTAIAAERTSERARQDATYATQTSVAARVPQVDPSVIIFGTSITAQNGTGPGTVIDAVNGSAGAMNGRGYWVWASIFLGQRLRFVRNAGIGGNTTTQMLARLQADVLAHASGWVVVEPGPNDAGQDFTAATTIANLTSMFTSLRAAGRRVVALTITPATSFSTSGRRAAVQAVNAWITDTAPALFPGLVVVDTWRTIADPLTGSPGTGMTTDGVHPSEQGAARMGKAISDVITGVVPAYPVRLPSVVDTDNAISNPLATLTGWSALGTGAVLSSADADHKPAKRAILTLTAATGGEHYAQLLDTSPSIFFTPGTHRLWAVARLRWNFTATLAASKRIVPYVQLFVRPADSVVLSPNTVTSTTVSSSEGVAQELGFPLSGEGWFLTPKILTDPTVTRLYLRFGCLGVTAGTVECLDVAVLKS